MTKYAIFLSQPALNIRYYFISPFPAEKQLLAGGFSFEVFSLQETERLLRPAYSIILIA
jgi:hypothetical protein